MNEEKIAKLVPITVFETQVEEVEGITLVVRASSETMVQAYPYKKKSPGDNTVAEWVEKRLKPLIGTLEIKIVDGEHESPRRSTKRLSTLRDSYTK